MTAEADADRVDQLIADFGTAAGVDISRTAGHDLRIRFPLQVQHAELDPS